jgi:hypothetical protein
LNLPGGFVQQVSSYGLVRASLRRVTHAFDAHGDTETAAVSEKNAVPRIFASINPGCK